MSQNARHKQQPVCWQLEVGLCRLGENGNGASVGQLHRYFGVDPTQSDHKRYFVVFVDDASRFVSLYLVDHRSEVYEKFEDYYERVKTQLHVRMKSLRSDNAKEFKRLQSTCESKYGMEFDSSIKHNGVTERMIRTITEKMRCMLVHFDLPEAMWGEAASTAAYCVNVLPSSARGMEVPYSVWYRQTPAYERLRTFGCAVLAYVGQSRAAQDAGQG